MSQDFERDRATPEPRGGAGSVIDDNQYILVREWGGSRAATVDVGGGWKLGCTALRCWRRRRRRRRFGQ